MARVMRTYQERWRFRHPSSDDFYAVAQEVAGRDLSWFFTPIVEGTGVIDYEIARATSERVPPPQGRVRGTDGRWRMAEAPKGGESRAGRGAHVSCCGASGAWRSQSTCSSPGRMAALNAWRGTAGRRGHKSSASAPAAAFCRPRPRKPITLDVNRINNGKRLAPDPRLRSPGPRGGCSGCRTCSRRADCEIVRTRALAAFPVGVRAAAHRPRLIAGLWAWQLVISTAVAFPLFRGLIAATAYAPGSDPLLDRFSVSLFGEILQYNALPLVQMLQLGAIGALLVSIVTAPVLVTLTIAALESPVRVPAGGLAASAGRWYFPLFRLLLLGRFVALAAAMLAGAATRALLGPVWDSSWELERLLVVPSTIAMALLVLALFWAAADYAAIHAIRAGSARMFAAWRIGLRASLGRPITTLALWLLAATIIAGLAALLFSVLGSLSGAAPAAIAAAIVVQQLFVIFRVGVRCGTARCRSRRLAHRPARVPHDRRRRAVARRKWAGYRCGPTRERAGPAGVSRSVARPEEDQGPGKDGQRQVHEGQQPEDPVE